jgi:hypothetical protein
MFFILLYVKVHVKDFKIYVIFRSFEVYLMFKNMYYNV